MTTAALYLRVSTEEQVSNLSLDTQEAECRAYCERRGWRVAHVFREEGASAKTLDRPEIQRLLATVGKAKPRIEHVVILRVDRLSRNREDFYVIRHALGRLKIRIASVREEISDDSISSMIVETFSVLQAQVDNLIRAGRAKTGMTEATRRGRWVWKAPIGYRHAAHQDGRPVGLELDPETAPLVALAFERVAGGTSADATFRELAQAGLKVSRTTFHAIFRKPIYHGRLEVAGWGVDATSSAPSIVSEELYLRARQELARRAPVRRETASLADFPLRGVARCACGRKLVGFHARGQSGARFPYYRCQRCAVQASAKKLDAAFLRMLRRIAVTEEEVHYVEAAISRALDLRAAEMEGRLATARKRLTAIEQRLEKLLSLRMDGEIGAEEYAAARTRLQAEREAGQLELADLTAPLAAVGAQASTYAVQLMTKPAEVWESLDGARRAIFAERMFEDGLTFADGELSNHAASPLGGALQRFSRGGERVVDPTATFSNQDAARDLIAWRARYEATADALLRAA